MQHFYNHQGNECFAGYGIWITIVPILQGTYEIMAQVDGAWEYYKFPNRVEASSFVSSIVD